MKFVCFMFVSQEYAQSLNVFRVEFNFTSTVQCFFGGTLNFRFSPDVIRTLVDSRNADLHHLVTKLDCSGLNTNMSTYQYIRHSRVICWYIY